MSKQRACTSATTRALPPARLPASGHATTAPTTKRECLAKCCVCRATALPRTDCLALGLAGAVSVVVDLGQQCSGKEECKQNATQALARSSP
jgi:hypothetical protein